MFHMRRGAFEEAWRVSDAVLRSRRGPAPAHLPRHLQWVWDGSPLEGRRVLVRCYHGLGDTLQFARYLPLVSRVARELIVWAQPALLPLLRTLPDSGTVLPLHDGDPGVAFDVDVEIMELPHVFRSTLDTLPRHVPYFHVDPMPQRLNRRPAVGLAWSAGTWGPHRSIPFGFLEPLLDVPVGWVILQGGPALAERPPGVGVLTGGHDDIYDAARVTRAVDLVITVDSMPAHLAGALGAPVWTLLPADADWRWMVGRDDSPWYPTMRLFRQPEAGAWEPLVSRVAEELRTWMR
jgi:hypothetical protein